MAGRQCIYRITGEQSIDRLAPLLPHVHPSLSWKEAGCSAESLDFVWETSCEKNWRDAHMNAKVLNKMHNSQVLEDKACMAFLRKNMSVPMLESYVASGRSEVHQWSLHRWRNATAWRFDHSSSTDKNMDWWAVKACKSNGGRDVWIMHHENFESVVADLQDTEEYIIQKYIMNPQLWRDRKYHFRCYTYITADLRAYLYEDAFILSAGVPYDADMSASVTKHITNLSVNKRTPNHPGQVPCHLPSEYPQEFAKISAIWADLIHAAQPYLVEQRHANNFEFFGIDIIADTAGVCWLLEVNRLPGLETSKINIVAEDELYNTMMLALLRTVLQPLAPEYIPNEGNKWKCVRDHVPGEVHFNSDALFKNLLRWRMHTRLLRKEVCVGAMLK